MDIWVVFPCWRCYFFQWIVDFDRGTCSCTCIYIYIYIYIKQLWYIIYPYILYIWYNHVLNIIYIYTWFCKWYIYIYPILLLGMQTFQPIPVLIAVSYSTWQRYCDGSHVKYNKELRFGKTGSGRLFGRAVPKIYAVQLTGRPKRAERSWYWSFWRKYVCIF